MASHHATEQSISCKPNLDFQHSTWARTFHSSPAYYFQPGSIEDIKAIVDLARKQKHRIVTVGAAHSPSELTCTSSILVRLNKFDRILNVQKEPGGDARVICQAGISLHELSERLSESDGLIIPNLGSIDIQSVAGAIATATHGSSLYHGLLSQNVYSLRICLADSKVVHCSLAENPDLFRAALVSLGGLGIVVEVELRMVPTCNIEWTQDLVPVSTILSNWEMDHWTRSEFTRCWWLPYQRNMIVWRADKTNKPIRKPKASAIGAFLHFYVYKTLLWFSHHFPRLLPALEKFAFGMQTRFSPGHIGSAVEEQREGLLMDCLFSQLVNEWAIPLHKGPEAILRLEKWLHNDKTGSGIPHDPEGVFIHYPIEVRVTDNSKTVRGYLDPTMFDGPTLYLNATLYRPFGLDPPCAERYYQAFEHLMKELGGRPHWAKNFLATSHDDFKSMYGEDLKRWVAMRNQVDPEGMFIGSWHRRTVLGDETPRMACEELEKAVQPQWWAGGKFWEGTCEKPRERWIEKVEKREAGSIRSEESFGSLAASTSTESEGVISVSEETDGGSTPER